MKLWKWLCLLYSVSGLNAMPPKTFSAEVLNNRSDKFSAWVIWPCARRFVRQITLINSLSPACLWWRIWRRAWPGGDRRRAAPWTTARRSKEGCVSCSLAAAVWWGAPLGRGAGTRRLWIQHCRMFSAKTVGLNIHSFYMSAFHLSKRGDSWLVRIFEPLISKLDERRKSGVNLSILG